MRFIAAVFFFSLFFLFTFSASDANAQVYQVNMVHIPGGTITVGEPESSYQGPPESWDSPQFSVTVSDFYMSETEVTNQQYALSERGTYSQLGRS